MKRFSLCLLSFAIFTVLAGALVSRSADVDAQTVTCNLATSCGVYQNTSSGPAFHGQGIGGYGIRGNSTSASGVIGQSASGGIMMPGVEGESTNHASLDAGGGFGLMFLMNETGPAYGALGYGSSDGIYGETENAGTNVNKIGAGVFGNDNSSATAMDFNAGVLGKSAYGVGVLAEANGTPTSASYGQEPIGLYAVGNTVNYTSHGTPDSTAGIGVYAESDYAPIVAANPPDNSVGYILATGDLLSLQRESTFVSIDDYGNFSTTGSVTTKKGTYARTTAASGRTLISYGGRTASPQIDDVGQAQLVGGRAFVRIDGDFADVIDQRSPYHVFLTADGDCKGLYIASIGPAGFSVHEMQGGRSTVAFEYRIVAKPVDENGRRLAVAPAGEKPRTMPNGIRLPRPQTKTPEELYKASVGAQAFARMVSNARRLQAETR